MMPEMDGHQCSRRFAALEAARESTHHEAKIVMTTALGDRANVMQAIRGDATIFW